MNAFPIKFACLLGLVLAGCQPETEVPDVPQPGEASGPKETRPEMLEPFQGMSLAQKPPTDLAALTGVSMKVAAEGKGEAIHYGEIGRFNYIGSLASGKEFKSTYGSAPEVLRLLPPLVPEGLAVALDGMKVGERRVVEVPPRWGYGDQGKPPIPPKAILLYDIELVGVERDLKVKILHTGNGKVLKPNGSGRFLYTGVLAKDGTVFDSTSGTDSRSFSLGQVVKGWALGLPGMKIGEKRRLYVPAALGYGSQKKPKIPPDSDLIFDVELVGLK